MMRAKLLSKKFVIFNLVMISGYVLLFGFTEYTTHTCAVGTRGIPNSPVWKASSHNIKDAYRNAQSKCEKHSPIPERCYIIQCEKTFF